MLRPYIEKYYILEYQGVAAKQPFEVTSPANCYAALVFNYQSDYQLCHTNGREQRLSGSFFAGYSTEGYGIRLQGNVGMVGVVFKSSIFRTWFPALTNTDINDQRIQLPDLVGSEVEFINDQLAEAETHTERIQLVESYLMYRLRKTHLPAHVADQALSLIMQKRGMIRMDDLANLVNVSPRHLRRVFNERVGLSPKFFARLKRFNYVNITLSLNKNLHWQEFTIDGGFYDQSHFIKDFVQFCGHTPSVQIMQNRHFQQSVLTSD